MSLKIRPLDEFKTMLHDLLLSDKGKGKVEIEYIEFERECLLSTPQEMPRYMPAADPTKMKVQSDGRWINITADNEFDFAVGKFSIILKPKEH